MYEVTRAQLVRAFDMWEADAEEHPDEYGPNEETTYGEDCADFLLSLLGHEDYAKFNKTSA